MQFILIASHCYQIVIFEVPAHGQLKNDVSSSGVLENENQNENRPKTVLFEFIKVSGFVFT